MNYLTHSTLVCLYPLTTKDHVGLLNTCETAMSMRLESCVTKYHRRGFVALDRAYDWKSKTHRCESFPYCGRCIRSAADAYTMRVTLSQEFGAEADVIEDGLSWTLGCRFNCRPEKEVDSFNGSVTTNDDSLPRLDDTRRSMVPKRDPF